MEQKRESIQFVKPITSENIKFLQRIGREQRCAIHKSVATIQEKKSLQTADPKVQLLITIQPSEDARVTMRKHFRAYARGTVHVQEKIISSDVTV